MSAEGAKNVSWPWLSPLRGWGSLTMSLTAKFIYIIYVFIIYIYKVSTENNCSIIYEGEQLLIHDTFSEKTTKKEKVFQYDVKTHETVLI